MSYKIDSVEAISKDGFCIPAPKLAELREKHLAEAPELSVLNPSWRTMCNAAEEHRGMIFVNHFWWSGEGAGHEAFELLATTVLPAFLGAADLVFTWEGGDSHSGLRIRNGVVTRHKVVLALGEEERP